MKISGKLTFNRVAVKMIDVPQVTKTGIILNNTQKDTIDMYEDHPAKGIVIAIGPDVTSCKEGDIVLINQKSYGIGLNDMGEIYTIIHEGDILLVREQ